jgi:hydrogenase-4 component E
MSAAAMMSSSAALGTPEIATVQLLDLLAGAILLTAVLILWRRELAAIVRLLALQGVFIAGLAAVVGASEGGVKHYLVALGLLALKAFAIPAVLRKVLADSGEARETEPLVNVTASLLAAALLTLLAYVVSQPLVALAPSPATRALPVGIAVVLLGFFVLVTRRRALSQVVGFLLLDNGITTTAFLAASGVPLVVELGVSLDVLLVVLVLQILAARMRLAFGGTDLDELNELRD